MKNRNLWRSIFALSAMVTLIGLGLTAYNHFVFHHSNNKLSIPTKNSFSKTRDIGERRKNSLFHYENT